MRQIGDEFRRDPFDTIKPVVIKSVGGSAEEAAHF